MVWIYEKYFWRDNIFNCVIMRCNNYFVYFITLFIRPLDRRSLLKNKIIMNDLIGTKEIRQILENLSGTPCSLGNVRYLLRKGSFKSAYKVGRVWLADRNELLTYERKKRGKYDRTKNRGDMK